MKVRVLVTEHVLVTPKDMLELNGMNMKILGKSQNQPNTSETTLAIPFPGKFYCLAPANNHVRKIIKASIIALSRPTLNEKISGRVA